MITTGGDKPIKIMDYISKTFTETLEGHTPNVSFAIYQPMLLIIALGSADGTIEITSWCLGEWTGCRSGLVIFQSEPENPFGKNACTCDSEVLTPTLQIATEGVTPGRSTHSATSKRTCVDGDIRQFHWTFPQWVSHQCR